jgi:hypothetical protein
VVVRALVADDDETARQTTPDPPTSQAPAPSPEAPSPPPASPEAPESPTPEAPSPDAEPEECTGGTPTEGVTGPRGRSLTGGGLRVPAPPGFEPLLDQAPLFTFADGVYAPSRVIEQSATSGWVAVYALGSLDRTGAGGAFDSLRGAAETVVACMAGSTAFYISLSGTAELASAETEVDGNPAWELTWEIRVDDPELSVEGDVAKVVVVDTGDPDSYGFFVSVVPIGDEQLIAEQEASVEALEVS